MGSGAGAFVIMMYPLLALVGGLSGVAAAFVYDLRWYIGGMGLPLGLVLALLSAAGLFVAAGMLVGRRLGSVTAALPWLLVVLLLSQPRAEGDLIVAGDLPGYVLVFGGSLLAAIAVTMPYGRRASLTS